MITQLWRTLRPPVYPGDEDQTRTAEILNTILLAVLVGAILASPLIVLGSSQQGLYIRLISTGALVLLAVGLLGLLHRGHLQLAGYATIIGIWLIVTLAILFGGGGVSSLGFPGYIILVLIAGILLGRQSALGVAGLGIITGGAFLLGRSAGWISNSPVPDSDLEIWVIQSVYLGVAAILLGLALRSIEHAFARSRQELLERQRAEAALRESEEHYRILSAEAQRQAQELQLLGRVSEALGLKVDLQAMLRTVVEATAETFGYTHVSLYLLEGETVRLQHEVGYEKKLVFSQLSMAQGIIGRVARTGQAILLEDVRADADYLAAADDVRSEVCVPLLDQGQVVGALNVESLAPMSLSSADLRLLLAVSESVNIAIERARLFAQLRESERRFRALVDHSYDGVTLLNARGEITYYSPSTERMSGYTSEERAGQSALALLHPDDRERVAKSLADIVQDADGATTGTFRIRHKDGSWRWIEGTTHNLLSEPSIQAIVVNTRDVTERKHAEDQLQASEERFRSLSQSAFEGLMIHDQGVILDANAAFANLFGFPDAEGLIGKNGLEILPFAPASRELLRQAIPQNSSMLFELEIVKRDGTTFPAETQGREILYHGRRARVVAMRDITERKQAEQKVREAETKYRTLVEQIPAVTYIAATDGEKPRLYVSPQSEKYFGITPAEGIADPGLWRTMIHPDDRERVFAEAEHLYATGQPFSSDYRVFTRDGRLVWCHDEAVIIRDEAGRPQFLQGVQFDITPGKQAEEAARRGAGEFAALYETTRDLAAKWDLASLLEAIVARAMGLLGAPGGEIYLQDPAQGDLYAAVTQGPFAAPGARLQYGEGMAGRVAQNHEPLIVDDYPSWEDRSAKFPGREIGAVVAVPLLYGGELIGVLVAYETRASQRKFTDADARLLSLFAAQAAGAVDIARLLQNLERTNEELTGAYETTLDGWSRALDLRDKETEGHTQRVTEMTLRLAQVMGVEKSELIHVRRGALLHDIGKMGVPDKLLFRPERLTPKELVIMRKHPQMAYDLLASIAYLRPALDIPYCHHEKWDGTGYPRGLKGEEIPFAARVFAIADVWDALRSDRPYRKAWPRKKVRAYILAQAGIHFDPRVVEAFLPLVE